MLGNACIVLAWFGFANPLLHLPAAVVLLPFGLACLAQSATTPRQALKLGWAGGALFFTLSLYWVAFPVHYYGGLPWFLAIPCPLLLAAYLGLFPGLFALILRWARPRICLLYTSPSPRDS